MVWSETKRKWYVIDKSGDWLEFADKKSNIDLYGRGQKGKTIEYKEEGLTEYRYSIVVENSNEKNYFTEKILDCFLTGTIPIYWGCPNLDSFFNINGVVIFRTVEELKTLLPTLDKNLYDSKIDTIKENFERARMYEINENLMYDLFTREEIIF